MAGRQAREGKNGRERREGKRGEGKAGDGRSKERMTKARREDVRVKTLAKINMSVPKNSKHKTNT